VAGHPGMAEGADSGDHRRLWSADRLTAGLAGAAGGLAAGGLAYLVAGPIVGIVVATCLGAAIAVFLPGGSANAATSAARDADPAVEPVESAAPIDRRTLLADLVRALPAPALLTDERRQILAVNALAADLLQRPGEGRPLTEIVRHPELLSAVQEVIDGGPAREVIVQETVPAERHLQALVAALPLTESHASDRSTPEVADTADRGALILVRDRTRQVQNEQMRVDFVANVSHELRTPLASLTGFLETLRGPAADDPDAQDRFLRIMEEQTARMTRLVESLMSLSRIEREEHNLPKGVVDLTVTVQRVVNALRIVADRFGTRIEIHVDADPALVVGDRDQIAQVAQNLIENAIKYGVPGTEVTVQIRRIPAEDEQASIGAGAGPLISLSVTDQGEGIPEEHLSRLTERFYRVDVARARGTALSPESDGVSALDSGGAGLGLAIVKHIVARHGGTLEIDSQIGVGSTFTALLPAAAETGPDRPGRPA